MNLSLQDVEAATAIKMLFLEAIEEGNLESLGTRAVYATHFMRAYAAFLGLDPAQASYQIPPQKFEFSYGIGSIEARKGLRRRGKELFPNFIWFGMILAASALAWYFARVVGIL